MSKPMFEEVFRFSGRRNRQSYLLFNLTVFGVLLGGALLVGAASAVLGEAAGAVLFVPAALALVAASIASIIVGAQRCRDFGWTGWAVLITVLPFVGFLFALVMLFLPGTQGPNRYGPDPVDQGRALPAA